MSSQNIKIKKKATKEKKQRVKATKKVIDGIKFDSILESEYYLELKRLKANGIVKKFSLQPRYLLQEGYTKYGRKIQKIEYVADFLVEYTDGSEIIIDVKGRELPEFIIKRKLFDFLYPNLILKLITYDNKNKKRIDYKEHKKERTK